MDYKAILELPIDSPVEGCGGKSEATFGSKNFGGRPIFAKQEDFNSRFFLVTLIDDRKKIPYSEYGTVTKVGIGVARGDGQSKAFLGIDNGDGTFTLPLDAWAVEIADDFILCDAMVWGVKEDGTNYLIRSANFRVYVQSSGAKYTDIMDGKTYDLLSKLLQDICEFEKKAGEDEGERVKAENRRIEAEQRRVEAESERAAVEEQRESSEAERSENENARGEAENARVAAEQERDTAEQARAAAEDQREQSERSRDEAETARAVAEQARVEAEAAREQSEETREKKESGRVDAEVARVSAEESRKTSESDRASAEVQREKTEAARIVAEQTRVAAEQDRAVAEGKREVAEKQRATDESKRADAEEIRVEVEEERAQAESVRAAAEKGREAAEMERAASELKRAEAEGTRAAAEDERAKAEKERASTERERAIAEGKREAAETLRASAEDKRVEADEERDSAEQTRVAAELGRDTSEKARIENEKIRATAENERATAETLRAAAETERSKAEEKRADAEMEREKAEVKRATAEENRAQNEAERAQAEKDRAKAETERAVAEGTRVTAEAARVAVEKERDEAEKARSTAETKREATEGARAKAETARDEGENKRASAEAVRAESEAARVRAEEERAAAEKERAANMPCIGENGNWFIGERDTGVHAKGEPGADGKDGTDGATWLSDFGEPTDDTGKDGDHYLDTETGNVYNKKEGGWGDPIFNLMGKRPTSKIYGVSGMGSVNPVWKRTYDASGVELSLVPQDGNENLIDFVLSDPAMQDFFHFQETTDANGNVFVIIPPMSFRYDRIHDGEVEALSVKLYEDGDEGLGYELHPVFKKWTGNSAFNGYGSVQIAKYMSSPYDTVSESEAEDDLSDRSPSEIKVRSVAGVNYALSYVNWDAGVEMIKATDPTYHMLHWMYKDLLVKLASIFFARADIYNMLKLEDGQTQDCTTGTTDEITMHSGMNKTAGQIKLFGLDAAFAATNINGIYWDKERNVYYTHLIDTDAATSGGYKKSSLSVPESYPEGYAGSITKISVDSTEKALAVPAANLQIPHEEDAGEARHHSQYYCSRYRDWGTPSERGQVWVFQKYVDDGGLFTSDGLFFSGWYSEFYGAWVNYDNYGGALRLCKMPS